MAYVSISYVGHPLPILGKEALLQLLLGKYPNKKTFSDEEYLEKLKKLQKSLPRYKYCNGANTIYSYDQQPGYVPEFEYKDNSEHKVERSFILPPIPKVTKRQKPINIDRIKELHVEVNKTLRKLRIKRLYKRSNKEKQREIYNIIDFVFKSMYSGLELVIVHHILDLSLK